MNHNIKNLGYYYMDIIMWPMHLNLLPCLINEYTSEINTRILQHQKQCTFLKSPTMTKLKYVHSSGFPQALFWPWRI